jgi:hypothetical protein
MTKVKWRGSILWLCTTLASGCIGPFPDEADESNGDSASQPSGAESDVSGDITATGPYDPSIATGADTTDPWPDPSATSVSGTATCGDCGTDGDTGVYPDDPQVCGVDIEHDPAWNSTYICGCEACNVEFNNVAPSTGTALLAECECICYEVGCGGSVSGGATSEVPDSDSSASEPTTASTTDPTWGDTDSSGEASSGASDDGGTESASASGTGESG